MTKIKVYACYTVKIYKNKPVNFFKTGWGGACPGSAFGNHGKSLILTNNVYKMVMVWSIRFYLHDVDYRALHVGSTWKGWLDCTCSERFCFSLPGQDKGCVGMDEGGFILHKDCIKVNNIYNLKYYINFSLNEHC